ncbi:MAG: PASTA domain-containing protein, partial [Bacillota bacterium]|nr:PASTA domain-containing protein [Bacillota bacterium]
ADIQKSKYTDFTFQFQSKYDSNYPIGVVLKQDPEANSKTVKAGSVIVLTVNSKEININTPYILNETEQQAKNDLLAKNLVPQIMYVEDGNSAPGYVTQTYPKAGVEVQLGSTIYVYVSKGLLPNFVTIPNLKGLSISDVQARLHALNLKYSVTYQESADYPKNTVISQTPLQDGKIEEGSTINLVVSKGVIVTRTASIDVDLPQQETNEVLVRVTVDGVQDTDDTKNLVPMYNATYTISVSGKSSSVVKVEVGGQLYRVYNVDFTQDPPAVSVTKYNYVMKTPATSAATQAPTVAPTQPVTKAR